MLKQHQRFLPIIALLAAFPPVTTDMYLPALPMLREIWGVSLTSINLTLVLFFVFFSAFLLVYGPISDSLGRRPLLLTGITIYCLGSGLCGVSANVEQLIVFRVLQAIGAAAASALSMAIAKDLFQASERERLLAHLGVIVAIAPMLSPIVGGFILNWLNWHWIFFIQAGMGAIALWGVYRMPEPLETKAPSSLFQMLARYGRLMKNGRYMVLNALVALSLCPMFAFIAGSPTIYISHFNVSEQTFGYLFGVNAFSLMAGSFACSRLTRAVRSWILLMIGFSGMFAGGVAILLVGSQGVAPFAATMFVVTFCIGMTRPMSNNLVLEQVDRDVGSASSLLVFLYFVSGAASMGLISLDWQNHIRVIGCIAAICGFIVF
ncbi:MAG: multidrug effflux MFS transporter, partial [Desulfobacterales bacterium]|nr:multidrug effflux MFS transporter [Desulfobacterales bacterium]